MHLTVCKALFLSFVVNERRAFFPSMAMISAPVVSISAVLVKYAYKPSRLGNHSLIAGTPATNTNTAIMAAYIGRIGLTIC